MDSSSKPIPAPEISNNKVSSLIALISLSVIASGLGWVISGFFHEVGHAFAVRSLGGLVTEFQPFVLSGAPHVAYTGNFTSIQKAIISVSGVGTVYLAGLFILLIFPFEKRNSWLSLTLTFGIVPFFAQSISYIILPILYLMHLSLDDDVISFIEHSRWNPFSVVTVASLLALLAGWLVLKRSRILSNIQAVSAQQTKRS